jgi:Carboxypeptidase regulatory-like domain
MFLQQLLPLLLLITFFRQSAAPPAPLPPKPDAFRIGGRVIDGVTGQPISRASVALNSSNSSNAPNLADSGRFELTDGQGLFAFAGVPPGKYVLSARRRGYIPQTYQQHEFFTTAIVVGPGLQSENLTFSLRPGSSISGVVVDESGDPLRHAGVMLFRRMISGGASRILQVRNDSTDDEGRYHFSHLDPGTFFVGVSAQPWYAQHNVRPLVNQVTQISDDSWTRQIVEQNLSLDVAYPVAFYSNAADLSGATPVVLRSGEVAIADFQMHPVPAARILVKTSAPGADQPANLSLVQPLAEDVNTYLPTQYNQVAPGLMEITGVPRGRFNLVVETQQGDATTRQSRSVQLENDAEVDVTQASAAAVVSGVMRVDDGSPVPQPARVRLRSSVTGESTDTVVSPTGEFSFKNNPADIGSYELVIIEPQGLFIRNLSSTGAKISGRSFQITSAQDLTITINASKGSGHITGTALKNDKPASGVMIVLAPLDLRSNPALFRRDQSDSDGTFSLNAIVPGRYNLMAIEDGWDLEWGNPDVLKKFLSSSESVEIAPHQRSDFKVNVQ